MKTFEIIYFKNIIVDLVEIDTKTLTGYYLPNHININSDLKNVYIQYVYDHKNEDVY